MCERCHFAHITATIDAAARKCRYAGESSSAARCVDRSRPAGGVRIEQHPDVILAARVVVGFGAASRISRVDHPDDCVREWVLEFCRHDGLGLVPAPDQQVLRCDAAAAQQAALARVGRAHRQPVRDRQIRDHRAESLAGVAVVMAVEVGRRATVERRERLELLLDLGPGTLPLRVVGPRRVAGHAEVQMQPDLHPALDERLRLDPGAHGERADGVQGSSARHLEDAAVVLREVAVVVGGDDQLRHGVALLRRRLHTTRAVKPIAAIRARRSPAPASPRLAAVPRRPGRRTS